VLSVPARYTAAVLTAVRTVESRVLELPALGENDLLVRVLATGICGSDLATFRGTHPYKKPPVVLGHELCGVVERAGSRVAGIRLGELVCSAAFSHCDECAECARGASNLCRNRENLCHLGWDGSFAEYVVLRRNMAFALGPGISVEAGAMAEPLSIAVHAARLVNGAPVRSVAVLGSGGIGLCCIVAAKQLGMGRVVAVDLGAAKAVLTAAAGADAYVDATDDGAVPGVRAELPDRADVTFVAAGYPGVLDDARAVTRPGGEVIVVSYFDRPQEISLNAFVSAELTVRFSALSTARDFSEVIGWLETGAIDPRPLITHRFPVSEAEAALGVLADVGGPVGKVMLLADSEGKRQ
jgi:2-desacetyl-2-hydroxyethyl bacteriochlorophyllide A dehydrogenase